MACLEHGIPPATYHFHQALVENLEDPWSENYGSLEKLGCHVAAEMFKEAGLEISPEFCLYDQLRKVANWNPFFDQYAQPVFDAVCRESIYARLADAEVEEGVKRAAVNGVLSVIGRALTSTPTIGGGALAGAGLGSLYWALNRHATEDDDKNEALKAKIKLYRRITSEIAEDLKRNAAVPADTSRNIIAQDAGTNNII